MSLYLYWLLRAENNLLAKSTTQIQLIHSQKALAGEGGRQSQTKMEDCSGCLSSPLVGVCLFTELKGWPLLLLQYHMKKSDPFVRRRG